METMAIGMQNLRIAQFLSQEKKVTANDFSRLRDGLNFIRRSLAAVLYIQEGRAEGLEPLALTEARYTSSTVRRLQLATDIPSFRRYLESLEDALAGYIESRKSLSSAERRQLEAFFEYVGEAMVSEILEGVPAEEAVQQDEL